MHTKGPWKLSSGADEWATIWSDKSEQIANILPPIANARLIAAAPELLEALENLLRCSEYKATDYCQDCVPAATKAIRKAKSRADTLKGEG